MTDTIETCAGCGQPMCHAGNGAPETDIPRTAIPTPTPDTSPEEEKQPETEFEVEERHTKSQLLYIRACAMFKVTPSSHFLQHLTGIDVSMEHRTLGDTSIKAIATTLVVITLANLIDIIRVFLFGTVCF